MEHHIALTASPHFSSGTPITAISSSAAWQPIAPSTSEGYTFASGNDHVVLSIHQEIIAVRIPPGHISGRDHPPSKATFVFAGSFRYALNSIGVRKKARPPRPPNFMTILVQKLDPVGAEDFTAMDPASSIVLRV
jgi:hypothetical protein